MSSNVLVLDMGYQPHRIVSWQRAVTMLFRNVAEIVEEYDEELRSVTFVMKVPAVIRLLKKVGRKRAVKFSRMNVLLRDKWQCQYCGEKLPTRKLNYDHVIPRKLGGKTTWENIVASCFPCNDKKGGRTPEQAHMQLLRKPAKPKSLPVVAFHIDASETIPEAWVNWVYWHGKLEEDT
jgi:5-methylcytosine-specific restriction endonuclease McrA